MKDMFIGVVFLTAQFLAVSSVGIVPLHDNCVEGEPLPGQIQPDLNLTVSPSLNILPLTTISIICNADVPRFPPESNTTANLAPVKITMHVGIYKVKECYEKLICTYDLPNFFPVLPRTLSCTAENIEGECRFKIANINLLPTPPAFTTTSQPRTTANPNTNVSTTQSSLQNNVTTPAPTTQTINNVSTTNVPQSNVTTAPVQNASTTASTRQNVTTSAPTDSVSNVSTTAETSGKNATTVPPTVPITNGTTTPPITPTEEKTTPIPTSDRTTRTPVSTTEQVIPPIPTTQAPTTPKDDDSDDDSDEDSDDDSSDNSDSDSDSSDSSDTSDDD